MYIVRASEVLPDSNIPLLFEPVVKSTPASLMTCMTWATTPFALVNVPFAAFTRLDINALAGTAVPDALV